MRNNLIIVCLLSGLSLPVCGQSTLDDCIRYAWKHNPGFKNVQIDVKEARTDYVAAMGKFLPYVSVQAEVGRHIGRSVDPDTNGYTADSYNQGTIGMDITLSLFEGFARINRLRYTHWTKKEKEWDHLAKKNDLAYRVAEAYYKAVLDNKLSELAAEQLRLGERYLKQTEAFVELGLKSLSDLQEVKARHQGDVFRERMYEKNRQMSFLYLKEILGMKEGDILSVSLSVSEDTLLLMPQVEVEEVYLRSVHVLPDYKRMEMWERAARKEYAVTLGQFSPTIFARFSWGSDFYNSLFSLHQLRDHWNKYIGVGISFPILSGLDRNAGMIVLQNGSHHYKVVLCKDSNRNVIKLVKREGGKEETVANIQWKTKKCFIKLVAQGLDYQFYIGDSEENMQALGSKQDASLNSSNKAGGFIGPFIGMYASSNGEKSSNKAYFDFFEYQSNE